MDETPDLLEQEILQNHPELPRWVQIPAGLLLGLFTLLCLFGCAVMLLSAYQKNPVLVAVIAIVLLLGCLWVLEKCLRLITGRKNRGGLMTPANLRVASVVMLLLPVAGLFTGYYRRMGIVAIYQAAMYLSGSYGLRLLAKARETTAASSQRDQIESN